MRHVLVSPRSRRILERNIAERKKEIVELFRGFGIEPHFFVHTSEDLEERDRGQDSGEDKEHRTEPSSRASALLEKDMAKLVLHGSPSASLICLPLTFVLVEKVRGFFVKN